VTNQFWSAVTSTAGAIDLRAGLGSLAAVNHRPAYYPADTHWSDDGALYLVRAIAEAISPGVTGTWRSSPADVRPDRPTCPGGRRDPHQPRPDLPTEPGRHHRPHRTCRQRPEPAHALRLGTAHHRHDHQPGRGARRLLPAAGDPLPAAAFGDATAIDYGGVASAPAPVISTMVSARTIVIEVVERNLTAGTAPFLQPQVIATIPGWFGESPGALGFCAKASTWCSCVRSPAVLCTMASSHPHPHIAVVNSQ